MRDPKRIKRVLRLIEKIWKKYPDLRLCQLIGNCWPAGDLYAKEDDELAIKLMEIYLKNIEQKERWINAHKEKII